MVLSGVGGQGILTIARVLTVAAEARCLNLKQAEVHGMSQRGGAVYSHLRLSDKEIFSDLIPRGEADLILSVEPLEALRYASTLKTDGAIVANSRATTNIANYPPIEEVLMHIGHQKRHISFDFDRLSRSAGTPLAANMVALGAASPFLPFSADELEKSIARHFARKPERIIEANLKAFKLGRHAGMLYLKCLDQGLGGANARGWLEALSVEQLEQPDLNPPTGILEAIEGWNLSQAEANAFENVLLHAYEEERRQLYEHEIYKMIEMVGAISPPRHTFIPRGSTIDEGELAQYPGAQVVVKLVSPDLTHKSDAQAVLFAPKDVGSAGAAIRRLCAKQSDALHVTGTLVVEYVEHESQGLGGELFVGIRSTREFGPVIAAGLGGQATEYLASKLKPGVAVAKALVSDTTADDFLHLFRKTAAYEVLAGRVRGHKRVVEDSELLRCFEVFLAIAKRFCIDRGEEGPDIAELEINPFAFREMKPVPLDGRGRLGAASRAASPRPLGKVAALLEPKSIAFVGISSKPDSFGRLIVENTLRAGFDPSRLQILKEGATELHGVPCVPNMEALRGTDLLIIAAPAPAVPEIVRQANENGVQAGIIISGGAGEAEGTEDLGAEIAAAIRAGRNQENGGTVFLGPNCMGVRSLPGKFDTFFIPEDKLHLEGKAGKPLALVSQSGAFVVSRLSSLGYLQPRFSITIGNQADVTVSDLLHVLAPREDLQVAGVYLEGFANLDGLETVRAIERWRELGKTLVIYKAGRTDVGRSAAAGHTSAVAGDYDVCQAALEQAGAIVAEDFRDFCTLVETATALCGRTPQGSRLFAVTNAGMEAVGMADAATAAASFAVPSEAFESRLRGCLERQGLAKLVSPRNPLDLTPAAGEAAYDEVVRVALECDEIDVVLVSCVPLAPSLKTLEGQLDSAKSFPSLARQWQQEFAKPIAFVVDAGDLYDPLVNALRAEGLAVFRSADEAVRALGKWLGKKLSRQGLTPTVAPELSLV